MNTFGRIGVAVLACGVAVLPARAQTNGFELQCASAVAAGRGCVTRAQSDLPTSLFRDPAGIAFYRHPALEVNVSALMPTITFQNAVNPRTTGARHAYPLPSVAFVGPTHGRLHWAVGLDPLGGSGSDFRLNNALLTSVSGTPVAYQSFFAAVKVGGTVAYELLPGFSVGASLSGAYAQIRQFRMPFSMNPSAAPGLAGLAQLDPLVYGPLLQQITEMTVYGDTKDFAGLTWAADAGVAYRTPSGWEVSASWSPQRKITLNGGTASIDMSAQFQTLLTAMVTARVVAYSETPQAAQAAVMQQLTAAGLDLSAGSVGHYKASTDLTLPATIGVGVRAPVLPWWTLSAEAEWRRWSAAADSMPFRLSAGDNSNLNLLVSGDPTNGSFDYPFPLRWKNTWSWKVGTEFAVPRGYTLRAGFVAAGNPVPANTAFITFPAIATNAVTFGVGGRVFGFPLDVAYIHALSQEIDGPSTGDLVASEYNGSRTTMYQDIVTVGTTFHF